MRINLAEKIADLLFSIAKYVITAAIISSFLISFDGSWKLYVYGAGAVVACFGIGVWIIVNKNKEIESNNK
jgi:hypothetical protein